MMRFRSVVAGVVAGSMWLGVVASAEDGGQAGRKILESTQNAVIKVKTVVQQKMLMNGKEVQSTESKSEATGTVIDPSGLVVVSLSTIDPSKLMDAVMGNMGMGGQSVETKFQLKDIKLILPDDTEVDAKVVLRDRDWDLAFVRPAQKLAKPLAAIDLKSQAQVQILDDVIIVQRLAKVANHEPAAAVTKVSAVVRKPRLFYIPQSGGEGTEALGSPVFAGDGKIVGIMVMRMMESKTGGGMTAMLGGAGGLGIAAIVLPAGQVLEASKQAGDTAADDAKGGKEEETKSSDAVL